MIVISAGSMKQMRIRHAGRDTELLTSRAAVNIVDLADADQLAPVGAVAQCTWPHLWQQRKGYRRPCCLWGDGRPSVGRRRCRRLPAPKLDAVACRRSWISLRICYIGLPPGR